MVRVPREIFELIGSGINLYETCKSFYFHRTVYYPFAILSDQKYVKNKLINKIVLIDSAIYQETLNYLYQHVYRLMNGSNLWSLEKFNHLTHLWLADDFNMDIQIPDTVVRLILGKKFNKFIKLPGKLKSLILGTDYDKNLILPITLIHFEMGHCFNQNIVLPNLLKNLVIGYKYNATISIGDMDWNGEKEKFPALESLTLKSYCELPTFPSSLIDLTIEGGFYSIDPLPNLKRLSVEHSYPHIINIKDFPSIESISIGKDKINIKDYR